MLSNRIKLSTMSVNSTRNIDGSAYAEEVCNDQHASAEGNTTMADHTISSSPAWAVNQYANEGEDSVPNDAVSYARQGSLNTESKSVNSMSVAYVFPDERHISYQQPNSNMFQEASKEPFSVEIQAILASPIDQEQIQSKPDGTIYLPEIHYRQILMKAFGPGGWSLIPRGPHTMINQSILTREYALFCLGRYVSSARGSAILRSNMNPAMISEAVRSNALMRCCKDLGIAHELWDPNFISQWKSKQRPFPATSAQISYSKWGGSNGYIRKLPPLK